jgi:DNA mismatch repair protein MutS
LPDSVLRRARELLKLLEAEQIVPRTGNVRAADAPRTDDQLALFGSVPHPVVQHLRKLDPNSMTPFQALEVLARLVGEATLQGDKA